MCRRWQKTRILREILKVVVITKNIPRCLKNIDDSFILIEYATDDSLCVDIEITPTCYLYFYKVWNLYKKVYLTNELFCNVLLDSRYVNKHKGRIKQVRHPRQYT